MRRMIVVLLVLAGCGEAPDRSRLAPGDAVVLVPDPRGRVAAYVTAKIEPDPMHPDRIELGYAVLPVGTAAAVARDDGPKGVPTRDVTVNLRGGAYAGRLAVVLRHCLHPDD